MDYNNNVKNAKLALLSMQRYSWEQGVTMQAFLEQGDMDVVIAMAKEAAYRQIPDGRAAVIGNMDAITDPCSVGEALLEAIRLTQSEDLIIAQDKLLDWALHTAPRNEQGIVYHLISKPQFWVDSMYMLPPYLAAAGYYEEAVKQINGYWNILFNKEYSLMSHMWDDEEKVFAREAFWGVGNGWTLAGLARVIDQLPDNMKSEKGELIAKASCLIDSILKYMRKDGLFHDVINEDKTFVETNLSQMLSYTLFRGMKSGWLTNEYEVTAKKLRKSANDKVDEFGLVQGVCGAPDFNKAGVAPEGQAFYLLMEEAAAKFYKS